MPLEPGEKLGPYLIEAAIGAGGMGAVYRARDTRLNRNVAIKTIEGRFNERFEREAKTIASLNHPNICTLYDVGDNYLVMELIDGAPIKGPLPVNEVRRLGAQIASGLEAAHAKGITHRDLKPGNILVTAGGVVKVIDFGLAKPRQTAPLASDATLTLPLTNEGTILGTAPYMSPEQVQGRDADHRSDIFSLGCVLYELLTGKRAFDGKTQVSIMAAILERDPDPLVEPTAPAWIDRLIRRCLEKNADDRWHSARDIALELTNPPPAPVATAVTPRTKWPWFIAAAAIAIAIGSWLWRPKPPELLPYRFTVHSAPGTRFVESNIAISPDGTKLALSASRNGKVSIWIHDLTTGQARELENSNLGQWPFWSPNGRHVGFFAGARIRRVEVSTGLAADVTPISSLGRGAAWASDGRIYFGQSIQTGLQFVSENGGPISLAVGSRGTAEMAARWPQILPGGGGVLFGTLTSRQSLHIWKPSGSRELKIPGVRAQAEVLPERGGEPGYLIFGDGKKILAQQFDWTQERFSGDRVPIGDYPAINSDGAAIAASPAGTIAFWAHSGAWQIAAWRDREGRISPIMAIPSAASNRSPSHDATRLVDNVGQVRNLDGNRRLQLSQFGERANGVNAVWSPDDSELVTSAGIGDKGLLIRRRSDGDGTPKQIFESRAAAVRALDWSMDRRFLLLEVQNDSGDSQFKILPMDRENAQPHDFASTDSTGRVSARFSPNGKWISYVSNSNLIVLPADGSSGSRIVVAPNAVSPRWRGDGKEIFYIDGAGKMTAVEVKETAGAISFGPPVALFDQLPETFSVTADGKRFLVSAEPQTGEPPSVQIIVNAHAELRRRAALTQPR